MTSTHADLCKGCQSRKDNGKRLAASNAARADEERTFALALEQMEKATLGAWYS
jgi:hypothetical protein